MRKTCARELRSFSRLSVANIVFAAMAMAFGVSGAVTGITAMVGAGEIIPVSFVSLLLGGAAFVVGIRWIRESARVLHDSSDLRREARTLDASSDEDVLRIMIGMMGVYRDRRVTVERMILIAKVGGAVFLGLGVSDLVTALGGAHDPVVLYGGFVAAVLNIVIGVAALRVSLLVGRYRAAWEARLRESAKAEAALTATMEQD